VHLAFGTLSRTGGRERNEDACGYWTNERGSCFVVCDGAGGHKGGALASEIAVRAILSEFASEPRFDRQRIAEVLARAEHAIQEARADHPDLPNMSATVAMLVIDSGQDFALWGQLGDTRVYLFRRGRAHLLTQDHSVAQSLVDAGYAEDRDTRSHPQRSVLYAALGIEGGASPNVPEAALSIEDGDAFLICSDGLWEPIVEQDMELSLAKSDGPEQWLVSMAHKVSERVSANHDNYTGLAVWLGSPHDFTILQTREETREKIALLQRDASSTDFDR
jgi:serine/threonine protein phosphatase PrpC